VDTHPHLVFLALEYLPPQCDLSYLLTLPTFCYTPSPPQCLPRSCPSSTPLPLPCLAICLSSPSPVNQPPTPATYLATLSSTCRHCCRRLPHCPHFPWAHFGIPKGEYSDFKHVIQLTTQIFCEQSNDPRSNSDPCTYILQYHICFADAHSPIYNLCAVFNSTVGPSPLLAALLAAPKCQWAHYKGTLHTHR